MSNQNNGFSDDDFHDPIHLNTIHKDMALDAASGLIKASRDRLTFSNDLPQSDLLICCHALLTYQQYESGHPNGFQLSMIESIASLAEKLTDIRESIDCSGAKPAEFWMQSDLAAIDKAKELGINILPEYSMADLRYKIYCAIHEVI